MESLYQTLETKKVGIFESPTGTGKTLSLICGAMTWLRDHRRKQILGQSDNDEKEAKTTSGNLKLPRWVLEHDKNKKQDEIKVRLAEFEQHLQQIKKANLDKENRSRSAKRRRLLGRDVDGALIQERKPGSKHQAKSHTEDDQYALDDYYSDGESSQSPGRLTSNCVTDQIQYMLDSITHAEVAEQQERDSRAAGDGLFDFYKTKIYFASRTHSQLTQFVSQARKPEFASVLDEGSLSGESLKLASLGSRKQLCIYEPVARLNSVTAMNAACMDAQKQSKCTFKKSDMRPKDSSALGEFRDTALSDILDVEDLHKLGQELKICPYYASRSIVPYAEIVTLPYQLLMLRSSREALGISLKDSIVIIDEAHNILEAISGMNSSRVSVNDVKAANSGLSKYWQRFSKRLNYGNRVNLSQIRRIIQSLESFMTAERPASETKPGTEVDTTNIFSQTSAENLNPFKLEKYLTESKLVFKVDSYVSDTEKTKSSLVLSRVMAFVLAIANPVKEGKLFWGRETDSSDLTLEYLLLDPSEHFRDIVQQARCVVLAGGTMEPMSDYINNLFSYVEPSLIQTFSCGHVIPKENLLVSCMSHGLDGQELKFTFANRSSTKLMKSLGSTLVDLTATIPKGIIVFLPSYQFMDSAVEQWKSMGLWSQLLPGKHMGIFLEPKDAALVEKQLAAYNEFLEKHGSALLFSVVGGKMSEGINFADDMARGVVMVGLPFPNLMSVETKAKREYVQSKTIEQGGTVAQSLEAAKEYYENLCMRAVNQCAGRVIRHANDYASIIFIDARYNDNHIQGKLSTWIRSRVSRQPQSYKQVIDSLRAFFQSKKCTVRG